MNIVGAISSQMIQFFLMLLSGFALVRAGMITDAQSKGISTVLVYLIMPCSILNAFCIDRTPETTNGLLLALVWALLIHVIFWLLIQLFGKIFNLRPEEKACIMYSNAGNLVLPIVSSILGSEWVIYCCAYMTVQTTLFWLHCKPMMCEEKGFHIKEVLSNINTIAIIIGMVLFFSGLRFPTVIATPIATVGGMLGPMGMISIGMIVGAGSLKETFVQPRVYLCAALRLLVFPLVILAAMKLSGAEGLLTIGPTVMYISYLATTTPSSLTVTQLAQIYGRDSRCTSAICLAGTVLCLATIPLMTGLYWQIM